MDKVKTEPADEYNACDAVGIKNEADEAEGDIGMLMEIKQEPELIIESEFPLITTNLQDEPESNDEDMLNATNHILKEYQEYLNTYIEATEGIDLRKYEKCLTEYIVDNEEQNNAQHNKKHEVEDAEPYDVVDNDSDTCMEQDNNDMTGDMDDDNVDMGNKKSICQRTFLKWVADNYVYFVCPICEGTFKSYNAFTTHINHQHKENIEDTKYRNYYIDKTLKAICKQCNKYLNNDYSLVLHTLRHRQQHNLKLRICYKCPFKSMYIKSIQNHIIKEHSDIKAIFKSLNITTAEEDKYMCPICPNIYNNPNHIRFHFIDKHPNEYEEIYSYQCHLCRKDTAEGIFDNMDKFYKHLLEDHNLKNCNLMNFKIFTKNSKEQYFYCKKCFNIFFEYDLNKLLQHFLEHDNYYRSCKVCNKQISIKQQLFYHMCNGQLEKFRKHANENHKQETNAFTRLQNFEEHIKHVCSFCNKEFETLQNCHIHLNKTHQLNTLKGLEMKEIPNDSTKLQCNKCNSFVINSLVQLNNHRFKHLDYRPYKCRHCLLKFNNFIKALEHVSIKCQDLEKHSDIKTINESHEMVCPLCHSTKFANKNTLLQHYIEKHNNFLDYYSKQLDESMVCNVCQLQVANDVNLCRIHIVSHFDQKPHKCLKCSQTFYSRNACLIHVNFHFAKTISQQEKMKNNLLGNSTSKRAPYITLLERSKNLNEFIDYINFACPECNLCLETPQLWEEHINTEHTFLQDVSIKDPLDLSLKCIHCEFKLTSSRVKQQNHKLTHMPYKSFICNICNHRTKTLKVLYAHLRKSHFEKGLFNCPICPESLSTSYERSEHLKDKHPRSEWPDTLCIVCLKTFAPKNMSDHMVTHNNIHINFDNINEKCEDLLTNDISKPDLKSNKTNIRQKRNLNLKSVNTKKKLKLEKNK